MTKVRRLPRGFRDPGPGPGEYQVTWSRLQTGSKTPEISIPTAERCTILSSEDGSRNKSRNITPGPGAYESSTMSSSASCPHASLYLRPRNLNDVAEKYVPCMVLQTSQTGLPQRFTLDTKIKPKNIPEFQRYVRSNRTQQRTEPLNKQITPRADPLAPKRKLSLTFLNDIGTGTYTIAGVPIGVLDCTSLKTTQNTFHSRKSRALAQQKIRMEYQLDS